MSRTTLCCVAAFLIVCGTSAAKAAPTGIWEGVIDDPARPLVVNVDLDKQILKLDGTGTTEWRVEEFAKDDAVIRFSVIVRGRKFQFTGSIADGKIIGEMKTPDRSLPFWLEPLPIFSTPGGRVEAWQQDLERVDRFLRYDRSYSEAARHSFVGACRNSAPLFPRSRTRRSWLILRAPLHWAAMHIRGFTLSEIGPK